MLVAIRMVDVGPSCVFQWAASYDDVEEVEGRMDGGGGDDDGVGKLHRVLVIGLMGVNERVEAYVLALVLCHHMLSKNVEEDGHLCTFVCVVHSMEHLRKIDINELELPIEIKIEF